MLYIGIHGGSAVDDVTYAAQGLLFEGPLEAAVATNEVQGAASRLRRGLQGN